MASHYYDWRLGRVHYDRRGMGDPMLLVHNIYPGASREEFERNIPQLARRFTIYSIDLPGFGDSDAPRLKYTAQLYIQLLADFLRQEIGQAAHVVSAGLSCAYVTEAAARDGGLFNRLVFICPRSEPTGLDSPRWFAPIRHLFLSTPALGSGSYQAIISEPELGRFLRECYHDPGAIPARTVRRLARNARRPGSIHAYASLVTGYLDWPLLSGLPKVQRPMLLIWGRQARPTPIEHSVRLVALARQCRLEVVEDAGAWVHDERSAKVNQLIEGFCDEP
jgi:pimeloyl-ACP methyl ester carboxylesterase